MLLATKRKSNMGSHTKRTAGATTPLSPRLALQLAAPHTWPAAIVSVLVAAACALANTGSLDVGMAWLLLLICILMQASVNTFNDYFDFIKGTDTAEDNVEASDSVLVYNDVNPRSALGLAIGFLTVAFLLSLYVIWKAGPVPPRHRAYRAVIVVMYSGGKTPLSYLPVGEAVSGIVMGGLIPLACYQVLSGTFTFIALLWATPTIIGVGLIMMTNNTCDIERTSRPPAAPCRCCWAAKGRAPSTTPSWSFGFSPSSPSSAFGSPGASSCSLLGARLLPPHDGPVEKSARGAHAYRRHGPDLQRERGSGRILRRLPPALGAPGNLHEIGQSVAKTLQREVLQQLFRRRRRLFGNKPRHRRDMSDDGSRTSEPGQQLV